MVLSFSTGANFYSALGAAVLPVWSEDMEPLRTFRHYRKQLGTLLFRVMKVDNVLNIKLGLQTVNAVV